MYIYYIDIVIPQCLYFIGIIMSSKVTFKRVDRKRISISCIQNFTSADEATYVGDFKYDQYVTSDGEPRTIEVYDTATSSAVSATVTDIAWDNNSQSYYFMPAYNMSTYEDLWVRACPGPYVNHGVTVGQKQARYKVEEI